MSKKAANNTLGSQIGRQMASWFTRLPLVKSIPVKILAYGLVNVEVDSALFMPKP